MEMGKYNWDIIKEIKLIEFNDSLDVRTEGTEV